MDDNQMKGKTVVITGPTSGIGKQIALGLAGQGASLILGCRDAAAGTAMARELGGGTAGSGPGGRFVEVVQVDLANQQSTAEFARKVLDTHARIDVLINNAAVSRGEQARAESADGIELTFATNVIGYFLTSVLLLQRLRESAPARIVNVASTFASDLDLDDLQFERRPFEGMKAYAQSKACDRLLTWALARRLDGTKVTAKMSPAVTAKMSPAVTANAMAPGLIVDTGLYRHTTPQVMERLRQRSSRTPSDGADTAIWLASSPEIDGVTGKLFENRKEIPCSFRNQDAEEKLWRACEELTRKALNTP